VERSRPITEDDILLTELLLARSYGNLKTSVIRTSCEALGSAGEAMGGTVRKHPYAAAGAAVGAGALLFGIFALLLRGGSGRQADRGEQDRSSRHTLAREFLSMLMPVVMPYVTAYVEKSLGRTFSRGR